MSKSVNFRFDAKLSSLDPDIVSFIQAEEQRQSNNLLMIASESLCPRPVREALTAVFTNKYAEGYPSLRMTIEERNRIEKEPERYLAFHRRYGDRRFYKGAEFSNFVEVLAQRRAAEIFANPNAPVDGIFVNVQPLSGAAANNAVYNSFLVPGDVIMGMSLSYGGHLTHGSPFNRSGRQYKVIPYTVDLKTGQFDYEALEKMALEHKPKIIIAGASAFPWNIDWSRFKSIAEKVPVQITGLSRTGAILMADISHPAGLVVAGLFNNPVGVADVTTFTTHKTMCGPRGAVIISSDEEIAKRIDLGVFPGEQGGPHLNNITAKAVAFKIASTKEFKALQKKITDNCKTLADEFRKLGFQLAYGGTNTHLVLIDLDSLKGGSGIPPKGDIASNILDICGITCNKNALPGDETGARPRGLRFGTTVLSQLGMGAPEMKKIAQLVHYVLSNIKTFTVMSHSGEIVRGKIALEVMEKARAEVDKLMKCKAKGAAQKGNAIEVVGERAIAFLQSLVSENIYLLKPGQAIQAEFKIGNSRVVCALKMAQTDTFLVVPPKAKLDTMFRYFNGLSDGYITWKTDDIYAKVEGPVVIRRVALSVERRALKTQNTQHTAQDVGHKTEFVLKPYTGEPRRTSLYEEHLKLTKAQFLVPFAGWSMPLWYTRASEEHQAVRAAAGLFDVSHMGKLEISGPYATRFLDMVTSNYVPKLLIGQSHYSYVLDADGSPLDDILLYRMEEQKYLMVVNASNKEKIEQWLNAVNAGEVIIDRDNPNRGLESSVKIVDRAVENDWVNVALQGPAGIKILLKLTGNKEDAQKLRCLKKTFFVELELNGITALIARTGYTGEEIAYEIFVARANAPRFWNLLLETGKEFGIKPSGLAARDSLRTEAGLPLYGHELNGENNVMPTEAGYGAFIKRHKPFFIGRKAYIQKEKQSTRKVVRFRITTPNARAIKPGDAVMVDNNRIGLVTSCTLVPGQQNSAETAQANSAETAQANCQIGLALIDKKNAVQDAVLQVIPTPRPGTTQATQPVDATILTRFMVKG
ncbi:MAG TPA: glycine cleavage system aminomethyltransferase GcvT [Planctomycetota bacterium]|nr:glycine cleavage system aminomethyltransferase GcvT [Planctomycetota bacterium]